MKYEVEIFVVNKGANVGSWHHTAWGSDNYDAAIRTANEIAKTGGERIKKVRVSEVILEIDRESN